MKRRLTAILVAFLAVTSLTLTGRAQTSDNETLALIDAFKQYKNLTPDSVSNLVHQIIPGIAASDQPEILKAELFRVLGNGKIGAVAKVSSDADGRILRLLQVTRTSVPDNLTDDQLAKIVKKDGIPLQKKLQRFWWSKAVKSAYADSLTNYPPDVAAGIVRAVTRPWFTVRKKPVGAGPGATWASQSLQQAYADSGVTYLTHRSTAMKLLQDMGAIAVPATTHVDFQSSGRPSVVMQLPWPWWTTDDIPVLQSLVDDPTYGTAAQNVLHEVFQM